MLIIHNICLYLGRELYKKRNEKKKKHKDMQIRNKILKLYNKRNETEIYSNLYSKRVQARLFSKFFVNKLFEIEIKLY